MQNNRDSSILRSLAVAFGDGLAFGVGMKLTQGGGRSGEAPAPEIAREMVREIARETAQPADLTPLLERLDAIEGRIGKVERIGKAAPAAIAPAAAPAPFDQKVLEAIVKALDARLLEQAGQVERRITELEARLAIELKTLDQRITQQDHSVVCGVQTHIEEWNGQFNDQLAAIRRRSDEERVAMQREIASLHLELAMENAQAVEHRTAELHAEIESRDSQIVELRSRLEAGDERLRSVVLAIGQACQTVVGRSAAPAKAEPERAAESERTPERVAEPSAELPLPGFAQPRLAARAMPVALVSSLVSSLALSAAGLAMLHYM
jgi:hypothetical protein